MLLSSASTSTMSVQARVPSYHLSTKASSTGSLPNPPTSNNVYSRGARITGISRYTPVHWLGQPGVCIQLFNAEIVCRNFPSTRFELAIEWHILGAPARNINITIKACSYLPHESSALPIINTTPPNPLLKVRIHRPHCGILNCTRYTGNHNFFIEMIIQHPTLPLVKVCIEHSKVLSVEIRLLGIVNIIVREDLQKFKGFFYWFAHMSRCPGGWE